MNKALLIVDDEENIIRALKRILRGDGYTIYTANSGQEGLALLAQYGIHVVLSDMRMPEMNGAEFLAKVKQSHPATVRMMLSGYTDLTSVTEAINQGAIYKFMTKPWEDETLKNGVRDAFTHYQEKNQTRFSNQHTDTPVPASSPAQVNLPRTDPGQILDRLPVAIFALNPQERVVYANDLADRLFPGARHAPMAQELWPAALLESVRATRPGTFTLDDANRYQLHVHHRDAQCLLISLTLLSH